MEETKEQLVNDITKSLMVASIHKYIQEILNKRLGDVFLYPGWLEDYVSVQNVPSDLCKHTWIMKEDGFEYSVTFKKILVRKNSYSYQMIKELI